MKKTIQITTSQFKQIIKEGVAKLHKKTLIENRIKQINEELSQMGFSGPTVDVDGVSDYFVNKIKNKGEDYLGIKDEIIKTARGDKSVVKNIYSAIGEKLKASDDDVLYSIGQAYTSSMLGNNDSVASKHFDNMMGNPLDNMDFLGENSEVASPVVMDILNSYLEAALWTEEEEVGHATIEEDISNNSKIDAYKDVKKFMSQAGDLLNDIDPEQVGHDLWLTRNGHGAGFWDRGLGDVGDKLTAIAKGMGSKSVYVGDDGKIYID